MENLLTKELELEEAYKLEGQELLAKSIQRNVTKGRVSSTTTGKQMLEHNFVTVFKNVKVFFESLQVPKRGVKPTYAYIVTDLMHIYAKNLPELYHLVGYSVLSTTLTTVFANSPVPLSALCNTIGLELMSEVQLYKFLESGASKDIDKLLEGLDKRVGQLYRTYYTVRALKDKEVDKLHWASEDRLRLMVALFDVVNKGCGYFEIAENRDNPKHMLEVQPTQWLLETWKKNTENIISKAFRFCPMVIEPKPWTSFEGGGYVGALANKAPLLRIRKNNTSYFRAHMAKLNQLDLTQVMSSINAIQETPWCINTRVLDVIKELMKQGGGMAGLPLTEPLAKLPKLVGDYTEEELKAHKDKAQILLKKDRARRSKAFRALSIINVADKYKDFQKIYFPHNMDFRGRVYPLTVLSPQGDDLAKSLLSFVGTPPITTQKAVKWLYVAGANFAGVDKVSYTDRIKWITDNAANIVASATDPIGNHFWMEVDEPLEFLAFCFEFKDLQEHIKTTGSYKGFKSHIPVAFDGTCSGLQHFSAILKDEIGGKAVNLVPSKTPQDIYALVAGKVNKVLFEDSLHGTINENRTDDEGHEYVLYGTKSLAQEWMNFSSTVFGTTGITRKVTKRSVMTLAYGSKEFGFKDQLLEDIVRPNEDAFVFTHKGQAARYLAHLIWDAVGQTVVKAVEGMKWLQGIAKLACKDHHVVSWVTPMNLCIQQSYMKYSVKTVWIRLNNVRFRTYDCKITGDIDKHHQSSGIAPNFIHSMDAAHLQMTVNSCHEKGIRHFAMIHDSYGTCASQAQVMYDTVRESFVKMYKDKDILLDFENDMRAFIGDPSKIPPRPHEGTLDITKVLSSPYTFA